MNLDRFSQGRDPQQEQAIAVCEQCREEIYPGEQIHRTAGGNILCGNHLCVIKFCQVEEINSDELEVA